MLVSHTLRVLTRDLETMQLQIHVHPIFVRPGDLEKMTEQFTYVPTLFPGSLILLPPWSEQGETLVPESGRWQLNY